MLGATTHSFLTMLPPITTASLLQMGLALLWCGLIFASAVGWGGLLMRGVGVRQAPAAAECVAGLAGLALVGGGLNLLRWLYPALLIGLVLVGAALSLSGWALHVREDLRAWRRPGRGTAALVVVLCCVFALRFGSTVHRTEYQGVDDYEAYLLFPAKMLQLHHFAADPFNERRLQSSIGITYFLQELLLSGLPLEDTQMVDGGVGLLLLAAAALALAQAGQMGRRAIWGFVLVAVAMPHIRFNLTLTTLPSALLLTMAAMMLSPEEKTNSGVGRGYARALVVGAAAGLAIGCKSTYLPHVFLFCVFFYSLEARASGWPRPLRELCVAGGTCVLVLLPWAVAMRQASGTYFFPVFGHGFDYTSYYHLPPAATFHTRQARAKIFVFVVPLLPFAGMEAWRWWRRMTGAAVPLALTVAVICGTLITGSLTGGDSLRRYNYPCILPALLLLLWSAMHGLRERAAARYEQKLGWWWPAGVAVLLLFWGAYMLTWENVYREMAVDFKASLRPWSIAGATAERRYVALQKVLDRQGIGQGATVLETLDYPFLLDFRTRRWWSADFPGGASLPPGWPIDGNGDTLARYLQSHGICYLAYSYRDQAFLGDEENAAAQTRPSVTQAWRNTLLLILKAHRQYAELASSRRHIYDDGEMYVLELTQRDEPQQAASACR